MNKITIYLFITCLAGSLFNPLSAMNSKEKDGKTASQNQQELLATEITVPNEFLYDFSTFSLDSLLTTGSRLSTTNASTSSQALQSGSADYNLNSPINLQAFEDVEGLPLPTETTAPLDPAPTAAAAKTEETFLFYDIDLDKDTESLVPITTESSYTQAAAALSAHITSQSSQSSSVPALTQSASSKKASKSIDHATSKITCPTCNKQFSKTSNLNTHIRNIHKEDPYECRYCKKRFAYDIDLKKHMNSHIDTKKRSFECKNCKEKFSTKNFLKWHTIHTCPMRETLLMNGTTNSTRDSAYSSDVVLPIPTPLALSSSTSSSSSIPSVHSPTSSYTQATNTNPDLDFSNKRQYNCQLCCHKSKFVKKISRHRKKHENPKENLTCEDCVNGIGLEKKYPHAKFGSAMSYKLHKRKYHSAKVTTSSDSASVPSIPTAGTKRKSEYELQTSTAQKQKTDSDELVATPAQTPKN